MILFHNQLMVIFFPQSIEKTMSEMFGPGVMSQWMTWSYRTDIQKVRSAVKYEVEQYLKSNEVSKINLTLFLDVSS